MALMAGSGRLAMAKLVMLHQSRCGRTMLTPNLVTAARSLFTSSPRLVDRPLRDEFTRLKSEYRIPCMSDQRVRERNMLYIPLYFLVFFFIYDSCWFWLNWPF